MALVTHYVIYVFKSGVNHYRIHAPKMGAIIGQVIDISTAISYFSAHRVNGY
jgi:hypothetical protein